MTPFHGWADPSTAAVLRAAASERTSPWRQPRFVAEGDPDVDCEGLGVFGEDRRTRPQKSFDAFIGLLQAGIRADAQATGSLHSIAAVKVTVSLDALASGVGHAFLDDVDEVIAAATAQEVARDAGYRLHVTGSTGEPLWQGDRKRYFTAAQRRSLAVRDGGCVWPQCTSPPSWTHAHHMIPVSEGGPTDVDNGTCRSSALMVEVRAAAAVSPPSSLETSKPGFRTARFRSGARRPAPVPRDSLN